jgi:hypothetical protein
MHASFAITCLKLVLTISLLEQNFNGILVFALISKKKTASS